MNILICKNYPELLSSANLIHLLAVFILLCGTAFSQSLIYPPLPPDKITGIYFTADQQIIFVNDGGSIYKSYDGGKSWKLKKHFQGYSLRDLKFVNDKMGFAIADGPQDMPYLGIVYTTDAGENWKTQPITVTDATAFLPITGSAVIKSTRDGKIQRLDNFFNEWTKTYKAPVFTIKDPEFGTIYKPYGYIQKFQLLPSGDIIAMGTSQYSILKDSLTFFLKSKDSGLSWDTLWVGLKNSILDFSMADDNKGWMCNDTLLYKTTNGGKNWDKVQNLLKGMRNLIRIFAADDQNVYGVAALGDFSNPGILRTTNDGNTWDFTSLNIYFDYNLAFRSREKGFVFGSQLYKTENSGESWVNLIDRIQDDIKDIDFVGVNKGFALGGHGIYKTTDGGNTWTLKFNFGSAFYGTPGEIKMLNDSTGWFLNTSDGILFKTDNSGESWKEIKLADKPLMFGPMEFYNDSLGIISSVSEETFPGSRVFNAKYHLVTTDGGINWSKVTIDSSAKTSFFEKMQLVSPNHLWGLNHYGLYLSTDTARTWQKMFGWDYFVGSISFCFYDTACGIMTMSYNEAFITTDGGKNWKHFNKPIGNHPTDCRILGPNIWGEYRVLESGSAGKLIEYNFKRNGDITWNYVLTTYTRSTLNKISVVNSDNFPYVWVAGNGFIVLSRQFEKISSVVSDKIKEVLNFTLSQNYPNPFNPATTISYSIPKQSYVELKVYDMLGREIKTLVNKEQSAGEYKVNFDGSSLPSGIYIYTIQSGQYRASKKLTLLK